MTRRARTQTDAGELLELRNLCRARERRSDYSPDMRRTWHIIADVLDEQVDLRQEIKVEGTIGAN